MQKETQNLKKIKNIIRTSLPLSLLQFGRRYDITHYAIITMLLLPVLQLISSFVRKTRVIESRMYGG